MRKSAFYVLRVGTAITFLLVAVSIFKSPDIWGAYAKGWAVSIIPIPLASFMIGIGIIDALIGIFLLVNKLTWSVALLGSLHLIGVIIATGMNEVVIRDLGILSATLSIFIASLPSRFLAKFITKQL